MKTYSIRNSRVMSSTDAVVIKSFELVVLFEITLACPHLSLCVPLPSLSFAIQKLFTLNEMTFVLIFVLFFFFFFAEHLFFFRFVGVRNVAMWIWFIGFFFYQLRKSCFTHIFYFSCVSLMLCMILCIECIQCACLCIFKMFAVAVALKVKAIFFFLDCRIMNEKEENFYPSCIAIVYRKLCESILFRKTCNFVFC